MDEDKELTDVKLDLQDLFDHVEMLTSEIAQIFDVMDIADIPKRDIAQYWSEYNRFKRLSRALLQANRRVLEVINPTPFIEAQKRLQHARAYEQTKCIKCGCRLEMQEDPDRGVCISCQKSCGQENRMRGAWTGNTCCDFCKKECAESGYLYDGQTKYRSKWATMCAICYPRHANLSGLVKIYKSKKFLGKLRFLKEN